MAELSTLARPYAKAAFQYAEGADGLQSWSEQIHAVAGIVSDDKVATLLDTPSYTSSALADIVLGLAGDSVDHAVSNFVHVLAENKRLKLLPQIANLFEQFKANRERSVDIQLVSAFELTEDTQQKLSDALAARLDRRVNVSASLDSSLLGGVLVRAGDTVIDGSVRGRLNKLAEAMNS